MQTTASFLASYADITVFRLIIQSLFFFSFLLRATKEDKYTRSPRNVCAGGYGLNHRCPYNYLLLKMPIILFYKTDYKAGTTIKMPIILFYKTCCKASTTTPIFHLVKLVFFKGKGKRQNFTSKGFFFLENAVYCIARYLAFFYS